MKWYAGIGSRRTPPGVCLRITALAMTLHIDGYHVRSGGAEGADESFKVGACGNSRIFKPRFATKAAIAAAAAHHPAWDMCSPHARKLHGRNAQIILGEHLDEPVEFVVCWTDAPPQRGGTQLGMAIAESHGIEVRNLIEPKWETWAKELIAA